MVAKGKGDGAVSYKPPQDNFAGAKAKAKDEANRKRACNKCDGAGWFPGQFNRGIKIQCPVCHGTGHQ